MRQIAGQGQTVLNTEETQCKNNLAEISLAQARDGTADSYSQYLS